MFNTISLARILSGKHPYKENATKEDYLKELKEEKLLCPRRKGMKDKGLFLICFMILCLSFVVLAQGRQILRIEENVDLVLERQLEILGEKK